MREFDGGEIPLQLEWGKLSGREVKVALIDSGINAHHSHVGWVAGGITVRLDPEGRPVFEEGYQDRLGHGTAAAGIIRLRAPEAQLYAVKIFETRLTARIEAAIAALEWSLDQGIKVVNLSLGTGNQAHKPLLQGVCQKAADQGMIIVASGEEGRLHYPAALPMVIGVAMDPDCPPGHFSYREGDHIEFRACGWPRQLPGIPQARNLRGPSFGSAHIAALCALIAQEDPGADVFKVRQVLKGRAFPPSLGGIEADEVHQPSKQRCTDSGERRSWPLSGGLR